ncbi:hypothetical protein P9112_001887 [Eukaryota sp. TZLM1-RC]
MSAPNLDLSDLIISNLSSKPTVKPKPCPPNLPTKYVPPEVTDPSETPSKDEHLSDFIPEPEQPPLPQPKPHRQDPIPEPHSPQPVEPTITTEQSISPLPEEEEVPPPKKEHKSLRHIFDVSRDVESAVPYHLDGDPSMEKPVNRRKRLALRTNSEVLSAIHSFKKVFKFNDDNSIDRNEYSRIHARICQSLYPSVTNAMIRKLCEDDWKRDSKGRDCLTSEDLDDVLFQLVDHWTMTVDSSEYIEFLKILTERVRFEGSNNINAYSEVLPEYKPKSVKKEKSKKKRKK